MERARPRGVHQAKGPQAGAEEAFGDAGMSLGVIEELAEQQKGSK